jgi:hypothetical protein
VLVYEAHLNNSIETERFACVVLEEPQRLINDKIYTIIITENGNKFLSRLGELLT